jgi:hypothetical protein
VQLRVLRVRLLGTGCGSGLGYYEYSTGGGRTEGCSEYSEGYSTGTLLVLYGYCTVLSPGGPAPPRRARSRCGARATRRSSAPPSPSRGAPAVKAQPRGGVCICVLVPIWFCIDVATITYSLTICDPFHAGSCPGRSAHAFIGSRPIVCLFVCWFVCLWSRIQDRIGRYTRWDRPL